jgi:hypothetical protein
MVQYSLVIDDNAAQSAHLLFMGSVRKGFSAVVIAGSRGIRTIGCVMSPVMSAF